MINLDPKQLETVKSILRAYAPGYRVMVFGSRVNGKPKPFSDLDLVLRSDGMIPEKTVTSLKDAFSASDLPIRVDVLDWFPLNEEFKALIEQNCEMLEV